MFYSPPPHQKHLNPQIRVIDHATRVSVDAECCALDADWEYRCVAKYPGFVAFLTKKGGYRPTFPHFSSDIEILSLYLADVKTNSLSMIITPESFNLFLIAMAVTAVVVFIALHFVEAGYGMMYNRRWGATVDNRIGWVAMEAPVFIAMLLLWWY